MTLLRISPPPSLSLPIVSTGKFCQVSFPFSRFPSAVPWRAGFRLAYNQGGRGRTRAVGVVTTTPIVLEEIRLVSHAVGAELGSCRLCGEYFRGKMGNMEGETTMSRRNAWLLVLGLFVA